MQSGGAVETLPGIRLTDRSRMRKASGPPGYRFGTIQLPALRIAAVSIPMDRKHGAGSFGTARTWGSLYRNRQTGFPPQPHQRRQSGPGLLQERLPPAVTAAGHHSDDLSLPVAIRTPSTFCRCRQDFFKMIADQGTQILTDFLRNKMPGLFKRMDLCIHEEMFPFCQLDIPKCNILHTP